MEADWIQRETCHSQEPKKKERGWPRERSERKRRLWWNADKEWAGSSFWLKTYNCLFATKFGELSWNVSGLCRQHGFRLQPCLPSAGLTTTSANQRSPEAGRWDPGEGSTVAEQAEAGGTSCVLTLVKNTGKSTQARAQCLTWAL